MRLGDAWSPEGALIVNPNADTDRPTADAVESAECDRIVA